MESEYRYDYFHEHTGRVTFVRNLYDVRLNPDPLVPSTLDRSFEYDQVGRLSWTYTGAEATAHAINGQWGTQNGPYAQANFYDQFGNITQRDGWGAANASFTASYTNNRRNGLSYDLAGNLTNDGQTFTYDATAQQVSASYSGYALTQGYDGDTLRVKKTENGVFDVLPALYCPGWKRGSRHQLVFSVDWGWSRRSSAAEAMTASPEKT